MNKAGFYACHSRLLQCCCMSVAHPRDDFATFLIAFVELESQALVESVAVHGVTDLDTEARVLWKPRHATVRQLADDAVEHYAAQPGPAVALPHTDELDCWAV